MDARQLRHFAAVAQTLHFGRAAQLLGMTQPPLSQSIQALEVELGARLFERTRRSVALTPFGAQWRPQVETALAALAALPEGARRLRDGESGRLDLAFVSTADYSVLPTLVRRYTALFPDVEVALTEATSDLQIQALLEGEGSAGIIIPPVGGVAPDRLGYRRLLLEPLIAAVPESWVTEGRILPVDDQVTPEEMIGAPLIIFPWRTAPAFHDLVTGYYSAHGRPAQIVQEAIQMQTIISLVSAGMGVAFVPASMRNLARTGVRYMDLAGDTPQLETGLVWRRGDTTPTLQRFLDLAGDRAPPP